MLCQSSRNYRSENNARRVHGDHIIDDAKAEPIEDNNAVKFNCKRNPCREVVMYFEGAPKNNSDEQVKITSNETKGVPELYDEYIIMSNEKQHTTPGYVDFTDNKQLIGDTKMKSDGEKILKITDRIVQQVYHEDLMYRFQFNNDAQYSQLRSKANLS